VIAPSISITIVAYNSAHYLRRCLVHVLAQDYPHYEVIVVDNASTDDTPNILRSFGPAIRTAYNTVNVGFAAGQNQAIAMSNASWILTLNPDVRLTPGSLSTLASAAESDDTVGSACGKLLAMGPDFEIPEAPVFDSTGIFMTPNLRHFDRGSRLPDCHQFDRVEYVFGGTGAACLYRKNMIEDVSVKGEFFDSDFFAYREDADVAWRAQLLGWRCLYVPQAVGYHVRTVLPSNRRNVTAVINMHSVKNRWLLRIKNITGDLYRRHWFSITARDLVVIAGCVLREWSSLKAFPATLRLARKMLAKRKEIMSKRRVSDESIAAWFSSSPVSFPAADMFARELAREKLAGR
jgi:GT2 family glycosyltransferase